jgi:hypothetical protein
MGNISISQEGDKANHRRSQDLAWEKESYREGCEVARQRALKHLEEIEERLYQARPTSWKVIGWRERTLVTRFGELRIKRRLYRDEKGGYHFLLDQYLGWFPHQLATPDLQECLVEQATAVTFRPVSKTLEKMTAGVLSGRTIQRLVHKTAQLAIEKEKADWQALYERGEISPAGERQVPILFSEGDGVFINLQREEQKDYEVKQAIAYEGWKRLSGKQERYQTVNKRVYCQASEEIPFWEGAGLEWAKQWDLGYLKEIVIGGDGAKWIDSGIGEFAGSIRQLDGYHLARACGRGWQEGKAIYQAIRAGEVAEARRWVESLIPRDGQGVHKSRQYVERNLEKGRDWRTQSQREGRGLGVMESNEDKLVANRMKKRGLSWTIAGALRMNKAIQLAANGEVRLFCERKQPGETRQMRVLPIVSPPRSNGRQKWLEAGLPALVGPHASRPWVKRLRDMTYNLHLLN